MRVQAFLLEYFQSASLRIIGVISETDDSRYPSLAISYLFKIWKIRSTVRGLFAPRCMLTPKC